MKPILTILFSFLSALVWAQPSKTEVLTLGTFHFNFPNLDVAQTAKEEQIDVMDPLYQKEIMGIVEKIAAFRPTIIVIERQPSGQGKTDSLYNSYLKGQYQLRRNEEEQIGFRLARLLRIKKLYCVDEWGSFNERLHGIVFGKDSLEAARFETYYGSNPDSSRVIQRSPVFKTQGILAELRLLNDEENIRKSLGAYLLGPFKYESKEGDFTGVDFETGRWFNRNLKIFRNIQRINAGPTDRILVIFGAGHLNLLNYFFDCSPEFRRVRTNDLLQ